MSMVTGAQYTVTATATSLWEAIGSPADVDYAQQVDIKSQDGNTGAIYWGGSNVTAVPANAWGEIPTGKAYTFRPPNGNIRLNDIYIVGTADDVAHINVITF